MKRFLILALLIFPSASFGQNTKEWPKQINLQKDAICRLKLPASILVYEGVLIRGNIPIYTVGCKFESGKTLVNTKEGWNTIGFPLALDFRVEKIEVQDIKGYKLIVVELRSALLVVKLRFLGDPEMANLMLRDVLCPSTEWEEYAKICYAHLAEHSLKGEFTLWPTEKQIELMRFAHRDLKTSGVSMDTYKDKQYLSIDFGSGPNVYNTLKLNQSQRVARIINDHLLSLAKRFVKFAPDIKESGVHLTAKVMYRNFVNDTDAGSDQLHIYIPMQELVKFSEAETTSQQFIDACVVIVNDNRISVNLTL